MTVPLVEPAAMVIAGAESVASPATDRSILTGPSPAVTVRFAVAVIVAAPPSSMVLGWASTVTASVLSATVTSNVTSARSLRVCDVVADDALRTAMPVTATVDVPAANASITTAALVVDTATAASPETPALRLTS